MKPLHLILACLLLSALYVTALPATPGETPLQLVQALAHNEIQDRHEESSWIYHVQRTADGHTLSEQQVETAGGPVFRILAIDGKMLTDDQAKTESARLAHLLADPGAQLKIKQQHDQDEQRLQRLIVLLPSAFLYDYDGEENGCIRLKFRPNPAFVPPTFEARAFAGLAGTMLVDPAQKRLVRMQGQLINQIDFGFGILGRIEKGGIFEIQRTPVSPTHWKTSMVNVHISGHIIFFKSVSKQQDESRSNFQPTPANINLTDAVKLLNTIPAMQR